MEGAASASFETPLVVTDATPDQWRLVEPLRYHGNRDAFTVPPGYVTNFASVPRFRRYSKATVLHDYLCDAAGDDVARRQ